MSTCFPVLICWPEDQALRSKGIEGLLLNARDRPLVQRWRTLAPRPWPSCPSPLRDLSTSLPTAQRCPHLRTHRPGRQWGSKHRVCLTASHKPENPRARGQGLACPLVDGRLGRGLRGVSSTVPGAWQVASEHSLKAPNSVV